MTYRDSWFQQLVPVRTQCLRCGAASPVVHVPHGALTFGAPLKPGEHADIAPAAIEAFAAVGWHFGELKAYCPSCNGLGT